MSDAKVSTFEQNALELFDKLETTMRSLKDIEYSAAIYLWSGKEARL